MNCNCGSVFKIHGSHIQHLKISQDDNWVISAGLNDNLICKWEIIVKKVNSPINDSYLYDSNINKFDNYDELISNELKLNISLINEINYCNYIKNNELNFNNAAIAPDLKDNNIVIKNFKSKILQSTHKKILNDHHLRTQYKRPMGSLHLKNIIGTFVKLIL